MRTAIICHYNDIPPYVGRELDRLYGGRYACMPHFRHYGHAQGVHTYVVRAGDEATAVFLFKMRGGIVSVLNEGIHVGPDQAAAFADYVFTTFAEVQLVRFNCVETSGGGHRPPSLRVQIAQDLVLPLPATTEQYLGSLGNSTKKLLRNRLNRIRRDFPTFTFQVWERERASEEHVRAIIRFNRLRMENANKESAIDADEEERIVHIVRDCGFIATATIDGRLCAGAINYRIGRNFSARILAHDPAYDEHRLGFLCAYLTVSECIKHGTPANFYFGWGDSHYKYSLGAMPRPLSRLLIVRSRWDLARYAGQACATILEGCKFRLRQALLDAARRGGDSLLSKLAGTLVGLVRAIKPRG